MNPLGNRTRAEELALLLEGGSGRTGAATGLALLATRLRAVTPALDDAVSMSPEFRAALRQRLLAVATVQPVHPSAAPASGSSLRERALSWSTSRAGQTRLAVLSGTMAAVVALTGVGVASSRSLPGQPFYGLKRAGESLQLALAGNDTARGSKHLDFAATRLRELRALVDGDGALALGGGSGLLAAGRADGPVLQRRVTATLADFDTEAGKGQQLLVGVYRRTGSTAPLRVLAQFATEQQSRLAGIIPDLPAGTANAAQTSLELVDALGSTAMSLLAQSSCGASCAPQAADPALPTDPVPAPGSSATPTAAAPAPSDPNGSADCACVEPSMTPEPTPAPSPSPSPEPTGTPSATPTPTPTPTPSPTATPGPGSFLPQPIPSVLATLFPSGLPVPLPTALPTLLPEVAAPVAAPVTAPTHSAR